MPHIRLKVCGIRSAEEAYGAVQAGADALGFVFAPSRRQVTPAQAAAICRSLPPFVSRVGVFVDEDAGKVTEIAGYCGLDVLQFHGDENPQYCQLFKQKVVKSFRVKDQAPICREFFRYPVDAWLLDSYVPGKRGGTGEAFDWEVIAGLGERIRIILAGGLTPDNVYKALSQVKVYAVDVSSGVETNGRKDIGKICSLIEEIRRWERDAAR